MGQGSTFTPRYFSGFGALPAAYASLFAEQPHLTFDQSLVWLKRLAALLSGDDGTIRIVGIEANGTPVAAMPLIKRAGLGLGPTPDLHSIANFYTAHYGPIADASSTPDVIAAALANALFDMPESWQVLDLNPLDRNSPAFASFAAALRRRGAVVEPYFRFGNWYEEIGDRSYELYYGARPSQIRETVRRRRRKLEKERRCEIRVVTAPEDVDAAMDAYDSVYTKSWKQAEPHAAFLREVARDFATAGWLRLGLLTVDGLPAAAQLWFVFGGTASIFKLAYDPDYTKYSVGSVLTTYLMEHAIETDHVRVVDYLCGDDPYKKDWMTSRRERWGLRVFRLASVRGLAGAARSIAGRATRRLRRRPASTDTDS